MTQVVGHGGYNLIETRILFLFFFFFFKNWAFWVFQLYLFDLTLNFNGIIDIANL